MRRFLILIAIPLLLISGLFAQTPPLTQRIRIAEIGAKYKKPLIEPSLLDSGHLLLSINASCGDGRFGCMSYHMLDLTGHEIASLTTDSGEDIKPLKDGRILLSQWGKTHSSMKILDHQFTTLLSITCLKHCDEESSSSGLQLAVLQGIYCSWPKIAATIGSASCQQEDATWERDATLIKSPLIEQAVSMGARSILSITSAEIWFMDWKSRIFYLQSGGSPIEIPDSQWSHFGKDACSLQLYVTDKQRVFATCPQVIPMGPDDAIGLYTQVAVFDVTTHTTIARRTGSDYFLSLDGRTLGHLERNKKYIDLEPLP
jgi:hypothetical protein